jgi:transposase-like protein
MTSAPVAETTMTFVECPACHSPKAVLAFAYRNSASYLFCSQCQHVWNTRTQTEFCKPHVPL